MNYKIISGGYSGLYHGILKPSDDIPTALCITAFERLNDYRGALLDSCSGNVDGNARDKRGKLVTFLDTNGSSSAFVGKSKTVKSEILVHLGDLVTLLQGTNDGSRLLEVKGCIALIKGQPRLYSKSELRWARFDRYSPLINLALSLISIGAALVSVMVVMTGIVINYCQSDGSDCGGTLRKFFSRPN